MPRSGLQTSRIAGFYRLDPQERLAVVRAAAGLAAFSLAIAFFFLAQRKRGFSWLRGRLTAGGAALYVLAQLAGILKDLLPAGGKALPARP